MKISKTIPGFTLIETLLALGLTGGVLILGIQVYKLVIKTQGYYQAKVDRTYELARLQFQMQQDLEGSYTYKLLDSSLQLFDREERPISQYQKQNTLLIRNHDFTLDTFPLRGNWGNLEGNAGWFFEDTLSNTLYPFYLSVRSKAKDLP